MRIEFAPREGTPAAPRGGTRPTTPMSAPCRPGPLTRRLHRCLSLRRVGARGLQRESPSVVGPVPAPGLEYGHSRCLSMRLQDLHRTLHRPAGSVRSARAQATQHRCDSLQHGHGARSLFGIKLARARAKLQMRSHTFNLSRENILASWSCSPQIDEVCDQVCDKVQYQECPNSIDKPKSVTARRASAAHCSTRGWAGWAGRAPPDGARFPPGRASGASAVRAQGPAEGAARPRLRRQTASGR